MLLLHVLGLARAVWTETENLWPLSLPNSPLEIEEKITGNGNENANAKGNGNSNGAVTQTDTPRSYAGRLQHSYARPDECHPRTSFLSRERQYAIGLFLRFTPQSINCLLQLLDFCFNRFPLFLVICCFLSFVESSL